MTNTGPDEVIRESATVVILRESASGFDVLLLKKNPRLNYGGTWVFPGGIVEPQDRDFAAAEFRSSDRLEVALAAVLRETLEETGINLQAPQLTPFSNWLTPKLKVRRYNTLFFATVLDAEQRQQKVKIDGQEIVDYQWLSATEALQQQARQRLQLNGPSFVTLSQLAGHTTIEHTMAALTEAEVLFYEPRGTRLEDGVATVYHGDSLYDAQRLSEADLLATTGPKHRLYMYQSKPWKYEDTR